MKKVVIVTRRLIMGGIEKALLSMVKAIPKDEYEVDVLVMGHGGELEEEIPEHVEVKCLYGYEKSTLEKIQKQINRGNFIRALKISWYSLQAKISKSIFKQEMCHSKMISVFDTHYDIAISYHVPASFPVVFVMRNINAKTKIAWIHSDVSHYKKELEPYFKFYEKYDKIFCVSENALKNFNHLFPIMKEKTSVFYNLLDTKEIVSKTEKGEGFEDQFNGIRILTIGRLSFEKGQDIIPGVLIRLKKEGLNIRWYCIGDGDCRGKLESLIKNYDLEEDLILLGTKTNPYKFIKECNIYVQPSRHEGYCMSLAEARTLNKPIVTTDTVGGREQIESGKNGFITKFDEEELYNAIKNLIFNQKLRAQLEENLLNSTVDSANEINKLLQIVGQ